MAHYDRDETLKRIQQAFEVQRRALQALEEAMLQSFEASQSSQSRDGDHRLLSVQEVCEQLGMGRSWVYNQIRSGELPSVQLGGTVKIKHEDLEEYIQRHHSPSSFKAGKEGWLLLEKLAGAALAKRLLDGYQIMWIIHTCILSTLV